MPIGLADWRLPVSGPNAVRLAARLGADGIQLDLGGPGRAPWLDEAERLCTLHKALEESGVVPLAVSANILNDIGLTAKYGTDLAVQVRLIINRVLDVAAELGVRLVLLPSFRCSAITNSSTFFRTVEVLRWACSEAHSRDLRLATENVLAPEQLLQLIDLVGASNLRVVLDTGNPLTVGLDPVAILQMAAPVLADQVHIKSSNDRALLSVGDPSVLSTLAELSRANTIINALVVENDYRDGVLTRISADLNWLRAHLIRQPI